jgi:hypothetical protein
MNDARQAVADRRQPTWRFRGAGRLRRALPEFCWTADLDVSSDWAARSRYSTCMPGRYEWLDNEVGVMLCHDQQGSGIIDIHDQRQETRSRSRIA